MKAPSAPAPESEQIVAAIYSIDTSSLMDWHDRYFPVDIFVGLVGRMDALATTGQLVAPALVKEEVEKMGSAGLKAWADGHHDLFVKTGELLAPAQKIQGQFPGLLDPKAEFEEADAYVIALAQARGGVVVTAETSASQKSKPKRPHYIPDVCRDLGIPCINMLGLMRREGWTF